MNKLCVALLAAMIFAPPVARAQVGVLEFTPDSPATVKGYVNPLSSAEYRLSVSANQRVALHLTSTSRRKLVRFHIRRDGLAGKPLPGTDSVTDWEGVFKEGGDYRISVRASPRRTPSWLLFARGSNV